jgi:hypothetical protein
MDGSKSHQLQERWSVWKFGVKVLFFIAIFCATANSHALGQYISLDAIEVIQTVQAMDLSSPSMNNSVPLVAGKKTLVRAYFTLKNMTGQVTVYSGRLRISSPSGQLINDSINMNPVIVISDPALTPKRLDLDKTLNFTVDHLTPGTYAFSVEPLMSSSGTQCRNCGNQSSSTTVTLAFHESPPLRINLVPVRYYKFDGQVQYYNRLPENSDYTHIASWLRRAYPVSENRLEVTDIRNDPQLIDVTPYESAWGSYGGIPCGITNEELGYSRDDIIEATTDLNIKTKLTHTHFHGLVADLDTNGTDAFKGGCTDEIPSGQSSLEHYFTHPGSSPTGQPPQSSLVGEADWDDDLHYGDWYAAHEIAHALGLPHAASNLPTPPPTTVCASNIPNPTPLLPYPPYPHGQLSGPAQVYVGFDAGDVALGVPARILDGTSWHDLMTYCIKQWISDVTYTRIWCRLHEGNGLPCPANPGSDLIPPATPLGLCISGNRILNETSLVRKDSVGIVGVPQWAGEGIHSELARSYYTAGHQTDYFPVHHISTPGPPFRQATSQQLLEGRGAQYLRISAAINLKAKHGFILSTRIIPSLSANVGNDDQQAQIRLLDSSNHAIRSFPVKAPTGAASLSFKGEMEAVMVEIPFPSQTHAVELVVAGKLVDRRVVTTQPPTLQNIRIRNPRSGPVPTGMVVFEWDSDDPDGGKRTYIVRISRDQGRSWTPIIMNLTRPELALPLKQLSNTSTVRLRITASDGFNTSTVTSDPLALSP